MVAKSPLPTALRIGPAAVAVVAASGTEAAGAEVVVSNEVAAQRAPPAVAAEVADAEVAAAELVEVDGTLAELLQDKEANSPIVAEGPITDRTLL